MGDFTFEIYKDLIKSFLKNNYQFKTFEEALKKWESKTIVLRNDVDAMPYNSLKIASILNELNVKATFNFRIVKKSLVPEVIQNIVSMGHEIGYHYEDLALCHGNYDKAIKHFEENLNLLREFYPVKTICMHGSPLSKYDNRDIWKKFNYKDFGITGEPYFDVDFNEVYYLTDTGRSWNGSMYSIRDSVSTNYSLVFNSTNDIINHADGLPDKLMINIHPQRWNNKTVLWYRELIMQNVKNIFKSGLKQLKSKS